jgi:general secretion pathway protein M
MRISKKEKTILFVGGVVVLLLLYYLIVISPAHSRDEALAKRINKKRADLREMVVLKGEWDRLVSNKARAQEALTRRGKAFTPLSFLENISRKVGIQKNIQYMKPRFSSEASGIGKAVGVEMKLEGINIEQFVRFLYELEFSGKLLHITKLRIQKMREGKGQSLRVLLQIDSYTSV